MDGSGVPASRVRTVIPRCRSWSWARTKVATPLSSSSRPTKPTVTGSGGSGCGFRRSVSTPEPGMIAMRELATPSFATMASSSGFCTSTVVFGRFSREAQDRCRDRPQQPRLGAVRREDEAKTGERVQLRHRQPERGDRAQEGRHQRDVVDDVWLDLPVERSHGPDRCQRPQRVQRAAATRRPGAARSLRARSAAPQSTTRVMTCTSKPASRAARAIGRRWETKYQSSETR